MTTNLTIREATAVELKETVERFIRSVPTVKNLRDPEKQMVAALVLAYDLQPMHINVLEFGGRGAKAYSLYLNYDGRLFCATKSMGARFGGVESRPMTVEEKKLWDIPENEVGAVASVYQMVGAQRVVRATDIGRAGGQKDTNNPIARSNRQEMALKRAEARALRKAAPLGVDIGTMTDANDYDDVVEGEATFVDQEPEKLAAISEGGIDVDEELRKEGLDLEDLPPVPSIVDEPESEMQPLTDEEFEVASGLLVEAFQDSMISKTVVKESGIQTAKLLREGVPIASIVGAVKEKGLGW